MVELNEKAESITQKYLRRWPDSKLARSWAGRMVHIQTDNGVWRKGGSGYTYAGQPDAWVLPFEEAQRQVAHCGPEKRAAFIAVQSALPAPDDGLEVVGYAYRGPRGGLLVTEEPWKHAPEAVPLVNLSDAQAALQSKDEQIERLTRKVQDQVDAGYCDAQHLSSGPPYKCGWQARAEAAEQQVQKLTADIERVREALAYAAKGLDHVHNGLMDPSRPRQSVGEVCLHFLTAARSALEIQEQSNTPSTTVRPEVKSEREILKRLAAGDEIAFSQDGDDAFFTRGDRAFVGRVILSMRSKGYLKRVVLDDENYRGLSERDVISDAGLAALETQEGGK